MSVEGLDETGLVSALGEAALILDESDRVIAANALAESLWGAAPQGLLGVGVESLIPVLGEPASLQRIDGELVAARVHLGDLDANRRLLTARDIDLELRTASQLEDAERIARVGIWEWHVPTGVVTWSREAFRLFGRDPDTTAPTYQLWLDSIHPDDRAWVSDFVQQAFISHRDYDFEHRVLHADGTIRHLHCRGQVILGADGEPVRLVGASQDVTDRLLQQAELARAAARQQAILNAAGEGICGLDEAGRVTFANPAAAALLGSTAEQLIGQALGERVIGENSTGDPFAAAIVAGSPIRDERATFIREGEEVLPVAYHCAPIREGSRTAGAVVTFADASERAEYEEQLRFLAEHDALTSLLNRRRFEEEVAAQAVYAERYGGTFAVLVIDLDHFKDVNDTRGHRSGDGLIRSAAQALRYALPANGVLARLGGDEFAVLLPAATPESATAAAERLRHAVAEHLVLSGNERLQVTASVGVAIHTGIDADAATVLSDADVAMYDAKESGRNRVVLYKPELGARARMEARLSWTGQIKSALENDGFELFAQPIIPIGSTAPEQRYEVLLRLPQEDGSLARPASFLPIAERHGMICDIDRWVVAEAISILAARRNAPGPRIALEVNLSGHSMVDPQLPGYIAGLLEGSGVEPSQLIFEVTETAAIDSLHEARSLASGLVELGCEFAIDDFGAGFGSFAYLKHLPTQYVKIDGDFIRRLPTSPDDQLVVQAIAKIATGMGKRTIAEFVENQETLDLLTGYGIDFAQGYFTGRPGPVDEVIGAVPSNVIPLRSVG